MPRIFDCFTFYNELDLLEIRLNELDPVVDRFVLCEATATFRGEPKPLHFKENRDRFQPFLDKIVHVVVDDMPKGRETAAAYWRKQKFQRNAITRGLGEAAADDLILLSDLDEIPRAAAVAVAAGRAGKPVVFSLEMRDHRLFLNLTRPGRWNKARMARFGDIRTLERLRDGGPTWRPTRPRALQALRHWRRMSFGMRRLRPWIVVPDGGWHFSYMNGPEVVSAKLHAVSRVRPDSVTTAEAIAEWTRQVLENASLPHRRNSLRLVELDASFPAHLVANQSRFAHMIADCETFERYGVTPPAQCPDPSARAGLATGMSP